MSSATALVVSNLLEIIDDLGCGGKVRHKLGELGAELLDLGLVDLEEEIGLGLLR